MLTRTDYQIPKELIESALTQIPSDDFRYTINRPTGLFFYDPWEIKEEFKGTAWSSILNLLPVRTGEARIIILEPGRCYQAHADLDDRYHLNLVGDEAYLINLEDATLHRLLANRFWYNMNAGIRHTAMNVGYSTRIQLVVRQLLNNNVLKNPASVKIVFNGSDKDYARFTFDLEVSPLINRFNKEGVMNGFEHTGTFVKFNIENDFKDILIRSLSENFKVL